MNRAIRKTQHPGKSRLVALAVATSFGALVLAGGQSALAAPGTAAGCPNIDPGLSITVGADSSEFQKKDNRVLLKGSVTITQGVLTLFADQVTINYHSGDTRDKGTQGTITSLLAEGTVKFVCENDRAHAREALYDVAKHQIKMTGNVLLVRDENILKGEALYIDLDTGNTTIEGGTEAEVTPETRKDTRIKAVFTPSDSPEPEEEDTPAATSSDE